MGDSKRGDSMKTTIRNHLGGRLLAALTLVSLLALAGAANAQDAWVRKAKSLFENDEYKQVIELAEPHRKTNIGAMFLTFSHLQEFIFNGTKYDKEMSKQFKL